MCVAAIYEYSWTLFYLLILYFLIYFINPHNVFLQKSNKAEVYLQAKLIEYENELCEMSEKSSNKFDKYYLLTLAFLLHKLINIWESGLYIIPCSFSRLNKFIVTFTLLSGQMLLLPLMIMFYWYFVIYWFLKLSYYWLFSKRYFKRFRLSDKTGINRINPITFDDDEIIIPINCRTHDFIPKNCYSFEKLSEICSYADYGGIVVENEELWRYEPLMGIPFKKLLLKFIVELLIRIIIKRPYIWAFNFWGRLVSISLKINERETFSNFIYSASKSISCILIIGIPLHIIDLTASIIGNFHFSIWSNDARLKLLSNKKNFHLFLHELCVDDIFEKFASETADILYSSPFPVDVDNIRPL